MDTQQIIIILQLIILAVTLKLVHKSTTKNISAQAELELDKVLDQLVANSVKNHETKITKAIAKLTDQAEKELASSTTELTTTYRQIFDQKLDAVISQWTDHQRQSFAAVLDKKSQELSTISEALVQKVAEQSLKKHLTLRDHDQLVKTSLNDILSNLK